MNSRERVLTTIAHKEPDRVPLFFNAIEAKFVRAISQGDMIRTWNQLGCGCVRHRTPVMVRR